MNRVISTIAANVADLLDHRFAERFDIHRFDHDAIRNLALSPGVKSVVVIIIGEGQDLEARRRAMLSFSEKQRRCIIAIHS